MSEEQQKKIREVYNRIQENKKLLKELKTIKKDILANDLAYVSLQKEIQDMRKKLKKMESDLMAVNNFNYDKLEDLKIDIKTDEELLKDLALSLLMNNEQVELLDEYENKYIPELKVVFKKVNQ